MTMKNDIQRLKDLAGISSSAYDDINGDLYKINKILNESDYDNAVEENEPEVQKKALGDFKAKSVPGLYNFDHFEHDDGSFIQVSPYGHGVYQDERGDRHEFDTIEQLISFFDTDSYLNEVSAETLASYIDKAVRTGERKRSHHVRTASSKLANKMRNGNKYSKSATGTELGRDASWTLAAHRRAETEGGKRATDYADKMNTKLTKKLNNIVRKSSNDTLGALKELARNAGINISDQQLAEWANTPFDQYDDREHYTDQPEGETVDNSLRNYLNANPMRVKVDEEHTTENMLNAYKKFKGK